MDINAEDTNDDVVLVEAETMILNEKLNEKID